MPVYIHVSLCICHGTYIHVYFRLKRGVRMLSECVKMTLCVCTCICTCICTCVCICYTPAYLDLSFNKNCRWTALVHNPCSTWFCLSKVNNCLTLLYSSSEGVNLCMWCFLSTSSSVILNLNIHIKVNLLDIGRSATDALFQSTVRGLILASRHNSLPVQCKESR